MPALLWSFGAKMGWKWKYLHNTQTDLDFSGHDEYVVTKASFIDQLHESLIAHFNPRDTVVRLVQRMVCLMVVNGCPIKRYYIYND